MPERIKDNIFIITQDQSLAESFKATVLINNLTPIDDDAPLGSLKKIREDSAASGSLSFIKKDILDYIKNRNFPFLYVLDLRINTGIDNDTDTLRILKTLLLTYIILTRSEYSKDIILNLALIAAPEDFPRIHSMINNSELILNILKTGDTNINSVIDELKNNAEKFNNHFTVSFIEKSQDHFKVQAELNLFITKIKFKEKLREKIRNQQRKLERGIDNKKTVPAQVLYSDGSTLFINGENAGEEENGLYQNLKPGEFYIHGPFTGYNRLEIVNRIIKLIKKGLNHDIKFAKDENIFINLDSRCRVDTTIPVTLAQLLVKDLTDYKKIRIKIGKKNNEIMKGGQGYSMLSRYLILTDE